MLSACATFVTCATLAGGAAAEDDLTRDERAQLAAGKLVTRPTTRKKGPLRLIGGTSWQVIDAAPQVVYRALLDTEYYPHMLPRVVEAHVVEHRGAERVVRMKHAAGLLTASYFLKVKTQRERGDITFVVDDRRPHSITAAWGFYAVRPYEKGQTLLAYGVMADIGDGLLAGLVRDSIHRGLLKVPQEVKRFIEGKGQKVYGLSKPE